MADDAKVKASKAAQRAQSDFEQASEKLEQRREARRAAFEKARAAGLSTREIAEATGLHFTRVARILEGTKTDHGEPDAGRIVPVPATLAWMLEAQVQINDDSDLLLLFTTRTGRMWRERNFYRDLWRPAQEASGLDIRPHECRQLRHALTGRRRQRR